MIIRSRAFLVFAALCSVICAAQATSLQAEEKASVTCKTVSPSDGSLWIATDGDGLFRLGRNGRTVRYTEEGGQLGSNSVVWLSFDNDKVLWILDKSGFFRTYSSVRGFNVQESLPSGIIAAVSNQSDGIIYFATASSLFSLDPSSEDWGLVVDFDIVPVSLQVDPHSNDIWILSENSALKCTTAGVLTTFDGGYNISNMLPFVFDTNPSPDVVQRRFQVPLWLVIILALFAVLATWIVRHNSNNSRLSEAEIVAKQSCIDKAKSSNSPVEIVVTSAPDKRDTTVVPVTPTTSSNTLHTNGAARFFGKFTKDVISIIDENISDPDFDVDKLAAITGMSRIHVNRKLKSEGSDSPSYLIKNARMALAAKLLKNGNLTIAQISAECGFRTPSYFDTAFKDFYGVSPTDFLLSSRG